jgi:hypothetical protein
MDGPYPGELRMRVIDGVEGGGSRRGEARAVRGQRRFYDFPIHSGRDEP